MSDATESVPIQLTRMEGKFDLVIQRLDDLVPRVTRVESEVVSLKEATQRLDLEAKSRDDKALALAVALKDQKEAREADDNKAWSPLQRLMLCFALALAAVQIYQLLTPGR